MILLTCSHYSLAPKAHEKNAGCLKFAPQAKIFWENAHFLENFNKIKPIYHFLPFPISEINICCGAGRRRRTKKFEVLGTLCILSQFFCYLLLQVNTEIINPRARHLVFSNKQINILVDFLSPAVLVDATGAKNWEFWLFAISIAKFNLIKQKKTFCFDLVGGDILLIPYM